MPYGWLPLRGLPNSRTAQKSMAWTTVSQCSEFPCDKSGFPLDLEVRWRRNNEKMRDMGVAAYFELIKDKPRYP